MIKVETENGPSGGDSQSGMRLRRLLVKNL